VVDFSTAQEQGGFLTGGVFFLWRLGASIRLLRCIGLDLPFFPSLLSSEAVTGGSSDELLYPYGLVRPLAVFAFPGHFSYCLQLDSTLKTNYGFASGGTFIDTVV